MARAVSAAALHHRRRADRPLLLQRIRCTHPWPGTRCARAGLWQFDAMAIAASATAAGVVAGRGSAIDRYARRHRWHTVRSDGGRVLRDLSRYAKTRQA